MADISMRRNHDLDREQTRASLEKLAIKLCERLGGTWCWEGDVVVCESRGASARVEYDDTSILIEVSLPRAFKFVRTRLEAKIEEYFERYFRRT